MKPSRFTLLLLLCAAIVAALPRSASAVDGDAFMALLSRANVVVVAMPNRDEKEPGFRILLSAGGKTDEELQSMVARRVPPALYLPPLHGPFLLMLRRNDQFYSSLAGKGIDLKFADGTTKSIPHEGLESFIKDSGNEKLKDCHSVSKWFALVPKEQGTLSKKELRRMMEQALREQEPTASAGGAQDPEQSQKQKKKDRRQKRLQKREAVKSA
jgi:hypothetical protein